MIDIKTKGEVRHMNVRAEVHGDEFVPASDVKLMLIGVPCARIDSILPEWETRWYRGDEPAGQEHYPIYFNAKIENIEAKIGDVTLKGADIKKGIKITPQPGHVANVEVTIQASDIAGKAAALMNMLRDEVDVVIFERQLRAVGME